MELRTALFFSMSDAVLKLPTSIITALKVDEVGHVWFLVNRPTQNISEFDRVFPCRLDFFKKGCDSQVKVSGKAYIVSDPEELNGLVDVSEEIKKKAIDELVLIKVKIQNVSCFEPRKEEQNNWLVGVGNKIYSMLFQTQPQHGYAIRI